MNKDRIFYVYIHKRKSDGAIFYVGKGKGDRAYNTYHRNKYWKRINEKHGHTVEICQDNMAETDAFLLEMWLIAKIKHRGVSLANATLGGEGVTGHVFTDDQRYRCGNGSRGRKHTAESIKKMADSRVGYKHSEETRRKISEAHKRNPSKNLNHDGVTVYRSDGLSFSSFAEAERHMRINEGITCRKGNIHQAAIGLRKSAYGYLWSKTDIPVGNALSSRKIVMDARSLVFDGPAKACDWLRLNGFPKCSRSALSHAALKGGTAYGSKWRYTYED